MNSNLPPLVDTHCHLDFSQFANREEIIAQCQEQLRAVITSGARQDNNEAAIALAQNYPDFIFCTLGCHPVDAIAMTADEIDTIAAYIRSHAKNIVGIGEIGLDYYHVRDTAQRQQQQEIFQTFLALAEELRLPVVMHGRDAEKHIIPLLASYSITGIFHCFNGAKKHLERAQEEHYISVSTQVTHSAFVQDLVQHIRHDRLLLETDAPFLMPQETNYPWNVHKSFDMLLQLRNTDRDTLSNQLLYNTRQAFPGLSI